MRTIAAARFKAQCLELMDRVRATGEPLLITNKGRPVAKLVPANARGRSLLGCLAGTIEVIGDIVGPVVAPEEWEAERDAPR